MAKKLTAARKDKTLQTMLTALKETAQDVPKWPLQGIDPQEWEALPYRIRHNLTTIISSYIGETRAHG
jgi:hypothetical protein